MTYNFQIEVSVSSNVSIEKIHRAIYDVLVKELKPRHPLSVVYDFKVRIVRDKLIAAYSCKICKKKFHPKGKCSRLPKYCSNSCKTKAYRLRKMVN